MTYLRWCMEDNTDYFIYPTYMFSLIYDSDFGTPAQGVCAPSLAQKIIELYSILILFFSFPLIVQWSCSFAKHAMEVMSWLP